MDSDEAPRLDLYNNLNGSFRQYFPPHIHHHALSPLPFSLSRNLVLRNFRRRWVRSIQNRLNESVQVALSMFEEKTDQRKSRVTNSGVSTIEMEGFYIDNQILFWIGTSPVIFKNIRNLMFYEYYRKTTDELSALLKHPEIERDECMELRTKIHEFESKIKGMTDQPLETAKAREQLLHVLSELKTAQEEPLHVETDLADARESEFKAMMRAEQMETATNRERGSMDERLKPT